MIPNIKFHITAFEGSNAFKECMIFCYHGLQSLGYETTWQDQKIDSSAINILFGTTLSDLSALTQPSDKIIIFNLEQVSPEVPWFNIAYMRQLLNATVWDYNRNNITALQKAGVQNIAHVPLGYCTEMSTIQSKPVLDQDIDVLFYGSNSPRRTKVLDALRARGLNVVSTEQKQVSGVERDALIARAKVVLNVHYYETVGIFEIVRVSYLLANHKAVVSELSPQTNIKPDIKDAIVSGTLDELPELCWQLVHDDTRRAVVERNGFEIFAKRQAHAILQPAIEQYLARRDAPSKQPLYPAVPKTLNLGAGSNWRFDALNIDERADDSPDVVLDINQPLVFNQPLTAWRFGTIELQRGYFSQIFAKNIFQCSDDFEQSLTNCLDLLEVGGVLQLETPHDLSYGAWGHLGTKRTFNERTWALLLQKWWRFGWQNHTFEIINQSFLITSQAGTKALQEHNGDWGSVLQIPRMVDDFRVYLRKRELTEQELKQRPTRQSI